VHSLQQECKSATGLLMGVFDGETRTKLAMVKQSVTVTKRTKTVESM
jgi:hypothetical protein